MVSYSAQTFSTPVIWVFRPTGENSGLTMWHRIPHVYVGKPFFELAMHCLVSANQNTPCESRISKCSNIKIRSFSFWKLDYFVRWPLWKSTFDTTKFWQNFMLCLIKIIFFCDIWVRLWLRIYFTEYQHPIPLEKLQPRLFLWRISVLKS